MTINDPTSPTDTPEEFVALLKATADAAGAHGLLASQATLLLSLARHAGLRAPAIALHVTEQTRRTVRSLSAYQRYWTGIVRARNVLGKFTFVPDGRPRGRFASRTRADVLHRRLETAAVGRRADVLSRVAAVRRRQRDAARRSHERPGGLRPFRLGQSPSPESIQTAASHG